MEKIEYRVRPITRYVVTRYHSSEVVGGCDPKGVYDSEQVAYEVAYALAKEEHDRLGWPPGDERIQYPRPHYPTENPVWAPSPGELGAVAESAEYRAQAANVAARQA